MKSGKGRQSHRRRELRYAHKQRPGAMTERGKLVGLVAEEVAVQSAGTGARLRLIINDSSPLGWWSESTRTLSSVKSRSTIIPATLSLSNRRVTVWGGGRGGGHQGRGGAGVLMGHIWTFASFTTSQTIEGLLVFFFAFVFFFKL